ncbi:cysteine-rich secretory protein 2-like [Hydractinia symbiolongicarpus]|uniref:cysteine-rich secretory protein 2-like n=1 Tax=Hydractinia symbiolongicarpus TaxID=13093 RepID=UPI00254BBCE8|nr:cysteine-rich secretory protein 2-like [Hydractinia symbiolongicarpus]XP_057297712.1 cysteine-rich secretory protein 2-like [Hydractinia symbiolongicarpus]
MGLYTTLLLNAFICIAAIECVMEKESWIIEAAKTLNAHNEKRRLHIDTPDLKQGFRQAVNAKNCAIRMFRENLDPSQHPCNPGSVEEGENIYVGSSDISSGIARDLGPAMQQWYAEWALLGNLENRDWMFSADNRLVGHVTQVLWKSTTLVGCGGAYAEIGSIRRTYIVCRYSPQGNDYNGASLLANVLPLKNSPSSCVDRAESIGQCSYLATNPAQYCGGPFRSLNEANCPATCNAC